MHSQVEWTTKYFGARLDLRIGRSVAWIFSKLGPSGLVQTYKAHNHSESARDDKRKKSDGVETTFRNRNDISMLVII